MNQSACHCRSIIKTYERVPRYLHPRGLFLIDTPGGDRTEMGRNLKVKRNWILPRFSRFSTPCRSLFPHRLRGDVMESPGARQGNHLRGPLVMSRLTCPIGVRFCPITGLRLSNARDRRPYLKPCDDHLGNSDVRTCRIGRYLIQKTRWSQASEPPSLTDDHCSVHTSHHGHIPYHSSACRPAKP